MNKNRDRIKQALGLTLFALMAAWYVFGEPSEREEVRVKVDGSTYTASPDSTLEVTLGDSSSLRIEYEYKSVKDTSQDTTHTQP